MKNIVLPICCLLLNSCTTKFQNDITNNNTEIVLDRINKSSLKKLNSKQGMGLSLLHTAVIDGKVEIVKALVNRKVDLDMISNGLTPLHIAVMDNNTILVKILLEAGADKKIGYKKLNAYDLAEINQNDEILKLLK